MIWKYVMDFQSLHLKNISDSHQVWQTGHTQPGMAASITPGPISPGTVMVMLQCQDQAGKANQ